jgi:hypothetical protein
MAAGFFVSREKLAASAYLVGTVAAPYPAYW